MTDRDAEAVRRALASPFPAGSAHIGWLCDATEPQLDALSVLRLRDQAISLDLVEAEWGGGTPRLSDCWTLRCCSWG